MVFGLVCAITLALTGADLAEIMDHVGWFCHHTALYYLQLAKVLNPAGASARLSSSCVADVTEPWNDNNELKRFVSTFPTPALICPDWFTIHNPYNGMQSIK
jgi:hypothetical protein